MNIGDNQKNMMMSLPRERKLALLSMETETKATDPAKCLKYILLVQEADRKVNSIPYALSYIQFVIRVIVPVLV